MGFLSREIHGQVHLMSYGTTLQIPKGTLLHCQGNLEFHEGSSQSSRLELEGQIMLGGDIINTSLTSTLYHFNHRNGKIYFRSQSQRQRIRGTFPLFFSRLVLDNPFGLELYQNLSLSENLTLLNGKIYTGTHQLRLFNPKTNAITNFGSERYIVGNLRRFITKGKTEFPIGSVDDLQLLTLNFEHAPSVLFVDAHFTEEPARLMDAIEVDGRRIQELLNNGTWTLSSQESPATGFSLSLTSKGHSNGGEIEGMHTLLVNKGLFWEAEGKSEGLASAVSAHILLAQCSMNV